MKERLKPCPFCGGDAESDAKQSFRAFVSGQIEDAVAVYCRDCGAQISICAPDVPDITIEQVIGMWNARAESAELAALRAQVAALKSEVVQLHAEIMALEEDEADLRNQVSNRDEQIARQHAEILRLRMYAPGGRAPHKITMAPHVGPTNFEFYGIKESE